MPITSLVAPPKRETLSANVYAQLKELVLSGQMMPGEQISLRTTATALGVSVMPVREAMQRLVAEQALELAPNRAIRVPTMSASHFREITKIRIHLEGLATEQAATSWTKADLRQIVECNENFSSEMSSAEPNGVRLITFNKELHFAIYGAAYMPLLLQMIEALWLRIGPILNYDLRAGSRRIKERVAVSHHAALVNALQCRDGAAARIALQGDIESAAQFILLEGGLVSAGLCCTKPVR